MAEEESEEPGRGIPPKLVVAGVLVVLALTFLFQNTEKSSIDFLFFSTEVSLWFGLLASLAVGFVVGWLVRGSDRKRRKKS